MRKFSEEGLEQAFNLLNAQREILRVLNQESAGRGLASRHTAYDDGGLSG